MQENALLGIVLFPLLGAIANALLARGTNKENPAQERATVHWVACLSVAASFALSLYCFGKLWMGHSAEPEANPTLSYTAYEWFSITVAGQRVPVQVRFVMDALSSVMALVVTGIGLLIHIYSTGYMSEEKSFARFFSYLNLFTASMLILILGSNLPLMFVGWEGVGLCSYLLIGFWWENPAYAAAGRKAFVANRIGDFGVLIGMFILVYATGSFEFADINDKAGALKETLTLGGASFGISIATAATLFLFLGCTGKSAQIPLFVWLPDAMAGPTPVSALIHAATMVTSGIYLVCRMSPVFAVAPATMAIIAVIGAATALLAATIGCVQNDIKKVLAYSTVSQLGFMFAGAGCGAFAAGIFHVYTHAFFKACLFLGAGSVMHAVGAHGDADIRRLGGLRKVMPWTHVTFLVSCLAIAGVPLFSGFFSKDEILVGALSVGDYFPVAGLGMAVFAILVLAATMTAFYMFRLYFLTFAGEYRGGPEHHEPAAAAASAHAPDAAHAAGEEGGHGQGHGHGHGGPHESPASMTIPLIILGIGAVFAGYVWVGLLHFQPWVDWLTPALGSIGEVHHEQSVLFMALGAGVFAAVVGIGLAYGWYARPGVETPARLAQSMPGVHRFLMDKWRVDELYDATVLRASRTLAMVSAGIDKNVVDAGLTKLTAEVVRGAGWAGSRLQNGLVQAYAAMMVAGVLGAAWWFTVPHVELTIERPSATSAELAASRGLGYEYRWDFGGDGTPDTEWSAEPTATREFGDAEFRKDAAIAVLEPDAYAASLVRKELRAGERWLLEPALLGPVWQREPENDTPPLVEMTKDGLVVRRNGARLHRNGTPVDGDEVVLARGESIDIGRARVTAAGIVPVVLHVRNAFGVERTWREELELPEVKERPTAEVIKVAEARP